MSPPAGKTWPVGAGMAFVHEAASHRARPGVQVFVVAPHREIGIAVVQGQWHVADGMGQVETGHCALCMRCLLYTSRCV